MDHQFRYTRRAYRQSHSAHHIRRAEKKIRAVLLLIAAYRYPIPFRHGGVETSFHVPETGGQHVFRAQLQYGRLPDDPTRFPGL